MAIYRHEDKEAMAKYLFQSNSINGVEIAVGTEIYIDQVPAIIQHEWQDGEKTNRLMAFTKGSIFSCSDLARLMYETELALNPATPAYRELRVRISPRNDGYDVDAAIEIRHRIWSNS